MGNQFKNLNFYTIFGMDLILFTLSHITAYLIRFEFNLTPVEWHDIFSCLPIILFFKTGTFLFFGLYRGMWRYASINDMWRLLKASIFSGLLVIAYVLFMHRFDGFSRTVFILDIGLTFLFTGGLRFGIRALHQSHYLGKNGNIVSLPKINRKNTPILIIGAGAAGEKTIRELKENLSLFYRIEGLIDDDPKKIGKTIHNIPVLGNVDDIPKIADRFDIGEVLIAIPKATGTQMRRIVEICEANNIKYKTLPGWGELIDGKVTIKALRDVNYEDLLGRAPVELDIPEIEGYLKGQCVLVTGAGGSIGRELCRQIIRFSPEKLILLDASEANLYGIQMELEHHFRFTNYKTVLCGVQNRALVRRTFQCHHPNVVFHAAAYKHVPMLQLNPWQAVSNNIYGTQVVMEESIRQGAGHFVLVSTDKAVRPTNVMGASKRICELLLQNYMGNGTKMMAVRFGNVIGSSGSVIPLFRDQIARGGPVTVTHPEITRYFMTIPEAAQLILQAAAFGSGGEIFILKMGVPVKIVDLARDLIRLSGKEPDRDIEIEFKGLRPGEKLYEELITQGEGIVDTEHDKIMVLKANGYWQGHESPEAYRKWLADEISALYHLAREYNALEIKDQLEKIVPEYEAHPLECVI